VNNHIADALTGFLPYLVPEAVLALAACVLFLGGTWRAGRQVWGVAALMALAAAGLGLWWTASSVPTLDEERAALSELEQHAGRKAEDVLGQPESELSPDGMRLKEAAEALRAKVYSSPVQHSNLSILFKVLALAGGLVLLLFSWDEVPAEHAADYHACLLVIVAGVCLTGAANDLVTLFLALELVSIPTYVLLYLPRVDAPAQEAAMKYFLLSVFSSALLLFGFSYLYGVAGTTSLPALGDALARARNDLVALAEAGRRGAPWQGVTLVALVMVVAGLGFRITAVPFHFYAPDVYQGTTPGAAALLAFVPKVAGFAALVRVLGLVPHGAPQPGDHPAGAAALGEQIPMMLWIMAAVTMSLGNILALLQDNLRRLLAYSSVAHAGYMLIGLAVAPWLLRAGPESAPGGSVGGVEALLFYLMAYGAMTIGAFAVLHYLSGPGREVETVDDLAGLGRSHPGTALVMVLFLFSLIGIPLTAGFAGKLLLFFDALGLRSRSPNPEVSRQLAEQYRLYAILAVIGVINAAVGAWYYLRIAAVMYLREPLEPLPARGARPVLGTLALCAAVTLFLGIYANPVLRAVQSAVPRQVAPAPRAHHAAPDRAAADGLGQP
jgi:NADH-quinone oxidoreductase subunit N